MKKLKLSIFLLFFSLLIFSQQALGMEQKQKDTKSKSPKFLTIDRYVSSCKLASFIEREYEEGKPIRLKDIDPNNIDKFLKGLNEYPKDITFPVEMNLNGKVTKKGLFGSETKTISNQKFKELFGLIGDQIEELTLSNFNEKEVSLSPLKNCKIKKLTLKGCENLTNLFIFNLPDTLEELDFSTCSDKITGTTFKNMPKNIKNYKIALVN